MNRLLRLAVALMWIAAPCALRAQEELEVVSLNTIGYIKRDLPADQKLIAVSIPLESLTDVDNVFTNLSLSKEMPNGSQAFFWDAVAQSWVLADKSARGWSAGASNRVVAPGEAFFIRGPVGGAIVELTIDGDVPVEATLSRSIPGGGSLGILAHPYPVDFRFDTSVLASNATVGSEVFFWDAAQQAWVFGNKGTRGWTQAATNRTVQATEGFFLKETGTPASWVAEKPYDWP